VVTGGRLGDIYGTKNVFSGRRVRFHPDLPCGAALAQIRNPN